MLVVPVLYMKERQNIATIAIARQTFMKSFGPPCDMAAAMAFSRSRRQGGARLHRFVQSIAPLQMSINDSSHEAAPAGLT